jgi:hypothetical protein
MFTALLRGIIVAALAFALGVGLARAEIYTWVDAKGVVHVGNEPPPDGVRVTGVTPSVPQTAALLYDAAREAARQAEIQAMAERVRELEREADLARQAPPPAPIIHQVVMQWTPVEYNIDAGPPASPSYGCEPGWGGWAGCGGGWGSGFYSPGFVVARPVHPRRVHPQPLRRDRLFSLAPISLFPRSGGRR